MTATVEGKTASSSPRRRAPTRRSVILIDRAADWTITVGGIGVIVAVFGIMAFLAQVVVPLFTGGRVTATIENRAEGGLGHALMDKIDEYKSLSVAVGVNGEVRAFHVGSGKAIEAPQFDLGGRKVTAFTRTLSGANIAFGFDDGSVQFGELKIDSQVLPPGQNMDGFTNLGAKEWTDGRALYTAIQAGQTRKSSVNLELEAPQKVVGKPIVAMDYRLGGTAERPSVAFVTVDADGVGRLTRSEARKNLLTGETTVVTETATLPELPQGVRIVNLLITEKADQIYVAEGSGVIHRFDTRDFLKPALAESARVVPDGSELTLARFLIGEQALVVGSSTGTVDIYFRLQRADAGTKDGYALIRAHQLEAHKGAVVAFDASQRGKMFATADAGGEVWLRHATSDQTIVKVSAKDRFKIDTLVLAPRENGVLALSDDGRYVAWDVEAPHPETTLGSIFGQVWYEGYDKPDFTWQSSSGTDSFEPKFSLVPLIFGTIKAAFYSLLFAIPIALCAAIYTSEFLHHSVRAVVKPVMEMMASLPSVVLGFIAALILAPIVETWIAAIIMAFIAVPLGLLAGAHLWQLLPAPVALRHGGIPKFTLMFVCIFVFAYLSMGLSGVFERAIFAGDLKAWANGDIGTEGPFLTMLLMPLGFVLATIIFGRTAGRAFNDKLRALPRQKAGLLDAAKWLALLAVATVVAYALATAMIAIGMGPRGGVVDTYVQRNALVVGFAMGFAVIPIIYTIAEDALNSVPEHLRAASLACGATPWQTAVNVILPTAMSGVFAAIMVGMGRAVGETMIVVMAAGNTPLLEWNIFNGLRALSANIAVELPEAVKDSTLYRMLFLAALTLFVMTFVINTLAEIVRLRFRRRASQL